MQVHHHTKYKEIHGVDEVVIMSRGEHTRLHKRLRKEGKCNIPVKELAKISVNANARLPQITIKKSTYKRLVAFRIGDEVLNTTLKRILDTIEHRTKQASFDLF